MGRTREAPVGPAGCEGESIVIEKYSTRMKTQTLSVLSSTAVAPHCALWNDEKDFGHLSPVMFVAIVIPWSSICPCS